MPFYSQKCIIKENMMNIKMLKAAVAGLVLSVSGFANAGLITFDAGTGTPASYTENGLTVLSAYTGSNHLHFSSGALYNHGNCCSTPYKFELVSGDLFDLVSFDIRALSGIGISSLTASNGTTLAISATAQTYNLSSDWENLSWVSWHIAGSNNSYMDNFNYELSSTQVPEPSTLAIFALGIMGLAARRSLLVNKK